MSRAVQGTLLLIGSGVLVDSLAKALGALVSKRATCADARAIAQTSKPDLIVLAGDAAFDRGAAVLAQLGQAEEPRVPVIVIGVPNLAAIPAATPRHVALVTPEGGMTECARRVRAVVELFVEEGLAHCSFQQLADTVAPKAKGPTATLGAIKQINVTQPAPELSTKATPGSKTPTLISSTQAAKATATPLLKSPAKPSMPAGVAAASAKPVAPPTLPVGKPTATVSEPLDSAARVSAAIAFEDKSREVTLVRSAESPAAPPIEKRSPIGIAPKSTASALTPAAAVTPKREVSLPAGASSSKKPMAALQPSLGAPQPTRRTAFGIAPPSAAATPSASAEANVSRRGPPPLRAKAQLDEVSFADVAPKLQESIETSPSEQTAIRPVATPSPAPAAISGELASQEIAISLQVRPTDPPPAAAEREVEAPADEPTVVRMRSERPAPPPESGAEPIRAPFAQTARESASELEIAVSMSEPPPAAVALAAPVALATPVALAAPVALAIPAAARGVVETGRGVVETGRGVVETGRGVVETGRGVVETGRGASARAATNSRKPRRIGSPLEPARTPVQRADMPPLREKPASQVSQAVTRSEAPEIAVSFSEPPASASAPQPSAAGAPEPRHKAKRVASPLDPAPRPEQAPSIVQRNGVPSLPGLRVAPLAAQTLIADLPQPEARPRSKAGVWIFCGAAAIGCAVLLFQLLNGSGTKSAGGVAALGTLQRAAIVPTPSGPVPSAPVQVAPPAAAPISQISASPHTQPDSETTVANRSSASARKPALEHEPASEPGSAQALVDEGMALFKEKRLGLAEASYLKALKVQPGYPRAMAALVRVHIDRRDGAEAVRWAKQLVDTQPQNGNYLLLLGDAQQLRGDLDAAHEAWTRAAANGNATARERL